jgi:hypothetical protein
MRASRWRTPALLLAFAIGLTVLHTWPLALAPHRYSRIDNADYLLNAWAITWLGHQASIDPSHLFDANIFWPEKRTLAYSEAMLVQGAMAWPIVALGGSAVLAYNLVMMAGFALTAFAFGWVAHRWTGSWAAALVCASAAAFNAHPLMRFGHLQAMHVEFIAIVLFAVDRVVGRARIRDALLLAAAFTLQALTSIYLMAFTVWAMIAAAVGRLLAVRAPRLRALSLLGLAGGLASLALAPYLAIYFRVHVEQGFVRPESAVRDTAAAWADYLSTGSRLHYWWSQPFTERCHSMNFPGLTVAALVVLGLSSRRVRASVQARMCVGVVVGCLCVSCLPSLPGYATIHQWVPLFWAVRSQALIGQVVLLALALLAAHGAAEADRRWRVRGYGWLLTVMLVLLVNAESIRAPIGWREFRGVPPIYDVLAAQQESGAVVEFPFFERRNTFGNAIYMLYSTRHWRPMLNGYSGFLPASYLTTWELLRGFPSFEALEALHVRGVRFVVIHRDGFIGLHGRPAFDALEGNPAVHEFAHDGDIYLYRLY